MSKKTLRGIIQSRGLGDIIIALPIARHYYDQGETIVWPICEEFYSSVKEAVSWVQWVPIPTDPEGKFFLDTPLAVFREWGVDPDEALYLYQYLNTVPELTDPEMFNILKFDQYKYQTAGVPFVKKWTLGSCIERSNRGELALQDRLEAAGYDLRKPYAVCHLTGSSARVDQSIINFIDTAVRIINVDLYKTASIFDWVGVLERAQAIICLDSVFANMVDQLNINGPRLYWIRRSGWDLTPVLGQSWTIVPTNLPIVEPTRVDPAVQAGRKQAAQPRSDGGLTSHVPFETNKANIPTSFMHALRK
jgi:hypothetical protein